MSAPPAKRWLPPIVAETGKASLPLMGVCGLVLGIWGLLLWKSGVTLGEFWLGNWGNIASLIGVLLAIFGFAFTVAEAKRASAAAKSAKQAAEEARDSVYHFDSIVELTRAETLLGEIMGYHRHSFWPSLPVLYAVNRKLLITLQSPVSQLSEEQKLIIGKIAMNLRDIDNEVERSVQAATAITNKKSNAWLDTLKDESDKLTTLIGQLKKAHGE